MKKKRNLYIIAFLCFITLVGVTIAYLQSTSVLENIFEAGTYKTITHEEFVSPSNWVPGDETSKTITTKNEGTIPVRVRVKLEEEWKSKNNDDLDLIYNDENAAIINLDNITDWIYKDGYYYYLSELDPGDTTSSLIKSVTFNPNVNNDVNCTTVDGTVTCESTGDGYDGGTYKLKITTETVQAKNYEDIWEDVPIMYNYTGTNPCTYNGELEVGAEFVNGQYTYRYRQERKNYKDWVDTTEDGWGVILTDRDSTDSVTSTLCTSINNKPIVSMKYMFYDSKATSIDLSSFDTSNVTSMSNMFRSAKFLELDLSGFNTSKVTDMTYMFGVVSATSISLSNLDTSNVTSMRNMFMSCHVPNLDLSTFDTSKVTDMYAMFWSCFSESIDLSSFDTSKVTTMRYMFYLTKATSLDLSSFDTSNVTDMYFMFCQCEAEELDLSNFNTSKVTNMYQMFAGSLATTIDVSNFDTSNVKDMNKMFNGSHATVLDLSSFDTSSVTDMRYMFGYCEATVGYARNQAEANKFNATGSKPAALTFVVKT